MQEDSNMATVNNIIKIKKRSSKVTYDERKKKEMAKARTKRRKQQRRIKGNL